MTRNERLFFTDNTVIRLNSELSNTSSKVHLGVSFFGAPDDMEGAFECSFACVAFSHKVLACMIV